jgi:hypothetical protein
MKQLYRYINTSIIYHKRAIILHNKEVVNGEIILNVKVVYLIALSEYITSNDQYTLDEQITQRSVIDSYKELIGGIYDIIKK